MTGENFIKVVFIHQLMHWWVVLKNNIKICIIIYIKTAPTRFGAVTPCGGVPAYMQPHHHRINYTPMYFSGLF